MSGNLKRISEKDIMEFAQTGVRMDYVFRGPQEVQYKGLIGSFRYRLKKLPGFRITESDSFLHQDIKIDVQSSESALTLQFMFDGQTGFLFGENDINIKAGKNYIWSICSGFSGCCHLKKEENCKFFEIGFHEPYLDKLANKYPDLLSDIFSMHQKEESSLLNKKCQRSTTGEMNFIISQIKNAEIMGRANQIYTEAKVLELLALQIQQNTSPKAIEQQYCKSKSDIDKIHEAKGILLSDLDDPPSILELSRNVGINDKKLRYGFKKIFNQTIYGCLFDYKMDLARKLLLDTDKLILEIADECGYDYASHFTTAFKRKFGLTPLEYRLQSIQKTKGLLKGIK